ncbi:MAG: cobalt-precorrin-5B (C(1))-methyltransferase CbiD [Lachnospiraceae bacterium]|nr:cobalt-precorrin-5B (C(1))-methyltransferase CbiD [Lachnospiraceae bacterium]
MKNGFTTGSCAAAASKAAALMLYGGKPVEHVSITTPAGVMYQTEIEDIAAEPGRRYVSCAVRKYSGDDPDVTNNMLVYASVSASPDGRGRVIITGGKGIGKVTRPGLDQDVGEYAINSMPRKMIEQEIRQVLEDFEATDSVTVEISAPGGEEIAAKTFNPRLGIEGGISIIGTTGIVEPMSTKAIIGTIETELRQKRAMGAHTAIVSPGNYGREFMKNEYGYDLDRAVKISNFIGESIDIAKSLGFENYLLVGHIGKLIKVAGGIMNTHSHIADCRMELIAASAIRAGASSDVLRRILDCVSAEEAYGIIIEAGIEKKWSEGIAERISHYISMRALPMHTGCIVYSNKYGLIAKTENADEMMEGL